MKTTQARWLRLSIIALMSTAGLLAGGCAVNSDGVSYGYDYGTYYGSYWGDDYGWHPYDSDYVGPPRDRPSTGGERPTQLPSYPSGGSANRPSQLPASRPMPPSRGGGGGGGRGGGRR